MNNLTVYILSIKYKYYEGKVEGAIQKGKRSTWYILVEESFMRPKG